MIDAEVIDVELNGRRLKSIVIAEVGEFGVPTDMIRGPIYGSALEIVDIGPSKCEGRYRICAKGNIVGTELISPSIRIDIRPKISVAALHVLLRWSTHEVMTLKAQELPVSAEENQNILDVFADRLVRAVSEVESNGWIPLIETRDICSSDIRGEVDILESYQTIFSGVDLRFVQRVEELSYNCQANRILKTAAQFVVLCRSAVSDKVMRLAEDLLMRIPACDAYENAREAENLCQTTLNLRLLDGARAYYYPALDASVPILQMLARYQGGSREIEDLGMRIPMEDTFESAIRNVLLQGLSASHSVRKESTALLYREAVPARFNTSLIPDMVVRPLGSPEKCDLIVDAKYKESPTAGDHYQIGAYLSSARCPVGAFVTVSSTRRTSGPRCHGQTADGKDVFEFALYDGDLEESLRQLVIWTRQAATGGPVSVRK